MLLGEADLVLHHLKALLEAGVPLRDIAVIAPYNLQVILTTLLSGRESGGEEEGERGGIVEGRGVERGGEERGEEESGWEERGEERGWRGGEWRREGTVH